MSVRHPLSLWVHGTFRFATAVCLINPLALTGAYYGNADVLNSEETFGVHLFLSSQSAQSDFDKDSLSFELAFGFYISLLTEADLCMSVGADADFAERPSLSGDRHHRQRNGEEVRQVLQEDALPVFTERSREKVS